MNFKIFILLLVTIVLFSKCKPVSYKEPYISLEEYKIVDGFELSVIASEPFLEAPVTMDFDNQGRMWVVEMKGYMRNLEDSESGLPNGTISILEDLDKDGVIDHSKIFLDSLVLPRAIAHVYGGLLYAEPPNLWFVEINDDQPGNKVLVDSLYSYGGNVEHQPNGLMMNLDNWIYSAKSNFRYQRKNGEWIKEPTSFRGQWGISKDNFGRLYYNNNSAQLIGDYVLPNTTSKNPFLKPKTSLNKMLTKNQRVYPLHATSVNRGYSPGILDKDSLLLNVTSACGPMIYRGNQFTDSYLQNAFVCAPEANIVKRNILDFETHKTSAKQAYEDIEFIAATDEGFRPVNLFNGPDGAMYIVDMHRGIIQDKAFLTTYLHNQLSDKKLDTIVGMGRILRVKNKSKALGEYPNLDQLNTKALIALLKSNNGWLRDRAQQKIIDNKDETSILLLVELLNGKDNSLTKTHAIHALNGLNALSFDLLQKVIQDGDSKIISHALILIESFASKQDSKSMSIMISDLQKQKDPLIDLYLCLSVGSWIKHSDSTFLPVLYNLSKTYEKTKIYQEAIISGLANEEFKFHQYLLLQKENSSNDIISKLLQNVLQNIVENKKNSIYLTSTVNTDTRTSGYSIYSKLCSTCHGPDGNGIDGVAPPLKNSEFISGSSEKLALIILHGLQGPIHVNGKLYEFNGTMPGLASNKEYSDRDIVDIMNYIQNAFVRNSKPIKESKIKELREIKPKNGILFTEKELLNIK